MAGEHLFIDESARRNYYVSVAVCAPTDLTATRKQMRNLLLPGQRSLHMKDESDSRRRAILSEIRATQTTAVLFESTLTAGQSQAREDCLRAATELAIGLGAAEMVLDRSDSTVRADRRVIAETLHRHGHGDNIRYEHRARHEEPLLWIADALAWSWGRKGEFRTRSSNMIRVIRL